MLLQFVRASRSAKSFSLSIRPSVSGVEALEARVLLSVAIHGTAGDDSIALSQGLGNELVVNLNGTSTTYGPAQYAGGISIDTGGARNADTLSISYLPGVQTTVSESGLLRATVGSADFGLLDISATSLTFGGGSGSLQLTLDDSADRSPTNVSLGTTVVNGVAFDVLQGLSRGSISAPASLLVVNFGNAGNTIHVTDTAASTTGAWQTVNLNTGTGDDTVNVSGTSAGTVLNINGQSGHDVVTLGDDFVGASSLGGVINVTNAPGSTRLTIDDAPGPVGGIVLDTFSAGGATYGSLQGVAPGVINFNGASMESLDVSGGIDFGMLAINNTPGGGPISFPNIISAQVFGVAAGQRVNIGSGEGAGDVTLDISTGRILGYLFVNTGELDIHGAAGQSYQDIGAPVDYDEMSLDFIECSGGTYTFTNDLDPSFGHSGIAFDGPTTHAIVETSQHVDSVGLLNGATMTLRPGANLFLLGGIGSLDGALDIGVNEVWVGSRPASLIRQWIMSGLAGGPGITSSAVDAAHTVGYSAGVVKWTLYGDANLDGAVDFNDLLIIAQNYGRTNANWYEGDFNYDGKVDFADLLKLGQNYGRRIGTSPQSP